MKRPEAWHEMYKMIAENFKLIKTDKDGSVLEIPRARLTVEEVALLMNINKKSVCKRYPDGWRNENSGTGRGKTIRIDSLLDQEFGTY